MVVRGEEGEGINEIGEGKKFFKKKKNIFLQISLEKLNGKCKT